MKKYGTGTLLILVVLLLGGCSVVFRAGVGGTIVDDTTDMGIAGVQVYVYTEKSARDTDFTIFSGDSSKIGQSSSYRGRTTTANDGSFYFNRIIWETKKPVFGKTADYREVYFLYYHESYGVQKSNDAEHYMIASDSNNESLVSESFTKIDTSVSIALRVENFRTRTLVDKQIQAIVEGPTNTFEQTINGGSAAITVSYPTASPLPKADIQLLAEGWDMVDTSGTPIQKYSHTLSGKPSSLTLYVKETEPRFPALYGQILVDTVTANANDNQTLYLGYKDGGGSLQMFEQATARVVTRLEEVGNTTSHGLFSGLGRGLTYNEVHSKVKGATDSWSEVYLIWDSNNDGILTLDGATDAWTKLTVDQGGDTFNVGLRSLWTQTWP